ncbi:hypothetical protein [uncultured Brevundimonas sp.]|uniref:hypothetical protein n=1 Tax=uncultured Brevundimonas sp. TaxID=213418 RepID=UPI0030EE5109|tara:strand:- start:170 stop:580 length:411 start_codon:yes stop_codon:yes gene_type:complete
MNRLRIVLWMVAISQLVLGVLTLFVPAQFFDLIGLSTPPADNQYMLAMLGARFLAYGFGLIVLARSTEIKSFWIWNMVAVQLIDLAAGIYYTANDTLTLSVSAFPMFNAALFAALLTVFAWPLAARRSVGSGPRSA